MRSASDAIAEARAALNLPLADFARVVGVSPDVLARVDADAAARTLALRSTAEIFGLDVPEQLLDEAVQRRVLLPATRERWLGGEPAPPAPRPAPRELRPEAAAAEVRELVHAGRVDAALRVIWDSMDAWIDGGDLDACRSFLEALAPETVSADVIVSLLAASARVHLKWISLGRRT